jgi:hypothetical protein
MTKQKIENVILTRDDLLMLLEVYNTIDSLVDDTLEMMDVRLSQLSDARDKAFALQQRFNFRAPVGDDGNPNHWKPCVLPDDPNAWYYNEETA